MGRQLAPIIVLQLETWIQDSVLQGSSPRPRRRPWTRPRLKSSVQDSND